MFQNKKLKRNATYAIAEVAEVALCASNRALPTSDKHIQNQDNPSLTLTIKNKTKFFIKRDQKDKRAVITPTITK